MRQAGRYLPEYQEIRRRAGSFLELCYNPALAAEVTLQPVRRFAMDGAILFSDILVVPDALGAEVSFHEGEGPRLTPIRDAEGLARLDRRGVAGHLAPVFETVARVSRDLPDGAALIGFAGAPWTVATYMVEGGSSRDFVATKELGPEADPDGFQELIDLLVDASVEYLIGQVRHGVKAVQIFDSWAGVLPEPEFQRWCVAPARAMGRGLARRLPERADHRLSPRRRCHGGRLRRRYRGRRHWHRQRYAGRLGGPGIAAPLHGSGQPRSDQPAYRR